MVIIARENTIGARALLIGVLLALLIGLSSTFLGLEFLTRYSAQIYGILVILGLVVGFMNREVKDPMPMLYTGAILVIISRFGMDTVTGTLIGIGIGDAVTSIFGALLALLVPAVIIIALRHMFSMARI